MTHFVCAFLSVTVIRKQRFTCCEVLYMERNKRYTLTFEMIFYKIEFCSRWNSKLSRYFYFTIVQGHIAEIIFRKVLQLRKQ